MVAADTHREPRTYGNWREPKSPGLLGLGQTGTMALFGALVFIVILTFALGIWAAVIGLAVLALAIALTTVRDADGRNAIQRAGARAGFHAARSSGANLYRSGPLGRTDWGTTQLPGIAAGTKLSEHLDSYNRPFALVYAPWAKTYTVVLATEPDGSALVDQEQIDAWVAQWGHWLANLGDEPGVEAGAVTIETAPDSGTRLQMEVAGNIDPNAPAFARAMLQETVATYPAGSSTMKAYVTITFSAVPHQGAKPLTPHEMGLNLAARIPGMTSSLQSTGAGAARPVAAQELCEFIRVAYDPDASVWYDQARSQGEIPEERWVDVGPTAAQADWDGYRHDSAYSVTYAMTQAPRGTVQSSVLSRLIAPHSDIARKRVTLLYKPIDAARAAGMVDADVNAASFMATSGSRRGMARDSLSLAQARATAAEEARGAGLVNFGMLVTATVTDLEMLPRARAAIANLGPTARIRLRPVYGSQDSAFAAALPLGLVLSKHLAIPSATK
ncbi:hypothetical protein LQ757_18750 [Agromyces sp. SYSU K20354]|uniref:SCO6880 family protein n=1 Tax=Agromyces cavernae TaxID=2898659 RepID=UPI001E29A660|nr:SCO6880 family protein [Agromyces cavernae]MCD2444325.1 hypothetical protein [Agromyces cavernae]